MLVENYGWKLDSEKANEALEQLREALGRERADASIIRALTDEELAACVVFVCRMNDLKLGALEED